MSADTRFRTLVTHMSAIYASPPENRARVLQESLLDLVNVIKPTDAGSWGVVKADSERLLRVWTAVEEESYYAMTVANQLWDLLEELATPAPAPESAPALVISETILHVQDETEEEDVEEAEEEEEDEVEVEEEEAEEEEEEEDEVEVEEEEAEEKTQLEEVEEDEDEVEVEEAEEKTQLEEAEEALEVEQMFIRGRSYWVDINTKKLYADVNEEVGDEVGALVNGKPVFLSPK